MSHDVFLSYSRDDTTVMQRLRDDLRAAGLVVWTDESIEPGSSSWKSEIEAAIRGCGCLVVLLSPDAAQSKWVRAEIDFAESLHKPMYTLLVRGDETNAVPFGLTTHQRIDITSPERYRSGLPILIRAIRNRSAPSAAGPAQPTSSVLRPAPQPTPRRSVPLPWLVTLAALLVVLVIAAVWLTQTNPSSASATPTSAQVSDGQWIAQTSGSVSISVPPRWALGITGPPTAESLAVIYSIIDEVAPDPQAAETFKAIYSPSAFKLIFGNWGSFRTGAVIEQDLPIAVNLDVVRQLAVTQWGSVGLTFTKDEVVSLPAGDMLRIQGTARTRSAPGTNIAYFLPVANKLYVITFLIGSTDTVNTDLPAVEREVDAIMQTFTVAAPAS